MSTNNSLLILQRCFVDYILISLKVSFVNLKHLEFNFFQVQNSYTHFLSKGCAKYLEYGNINTSPSHSRRIGLVSLSKGFNLFFDFPQHAYLFIRFAYLGGVEIWLLIAFNPDYGRFTHDIAATTIVQRCQQQQLHIKWEAFVFFIHSYYKTAKNWRR